jgi:EAL domain-containing protein (putative c-di-GMP-specific phosphodiesterase class I)
MRQNARETPKISGVLDTRAIRALLSKPEDISLVAQPIIDLRRAAVVGYELLARFQLDYALPPDRVFMAATLAGKGAQLEALVLGRALELARSVPANCFVSINISPASLGANEVSAVLSRRSLRGIVFELTEHSPFEDLVSLRGQLDHLRAQGALIALDDAGAGHSGLRQLVELKPEIVKLDRELVRDVDTNEAKNVLVQMVGELANRLDAWVLAEGVEREEEAAVLAKLSVPLAQGFYFARPERAWPQIHTSAERFLNAQTSGPSGGELAPLVTRCLVVSLREAWPLGARLTVRVDATQRPITMQVWTQAGPVMRTLGEMMRVSRETTLVDAAHRAVAREEKLRWDPLLYVDQRGNLLGVIRVEDIVNALADTREPKALGDTWPPTSTSNPPRLH